MLFSTISFLSYPYKISFFFFFFFFNDPATTEIYTPLYTLSLHDALPISAPRHRLRQRCPYPARRPVRSEEHTSELQSHSGISYAVFCLKKKKKKKPQHWYRCWRSRKTRATESMAE